MIPIVDYQTVDRDALTAACRDWGFFVLTNHGIDTQLIEAGLAAATQFFAQPLAIKNRLRRCDRNCWGYNNAELTKNKRDWKEIFDIGPAVNEGPLAGASPQWPDIPVFQETLTALCDQMHRTALALVHLIGSCLDANINTGAAFAAHSSFLRLNYYPPCPEPAIETDTLVPADGELGISHHSDAGAVTVLLQDGMPGLQVYHNGRWVDVISERGAVVINIGDVVQVWSNDVFRAPLHRVVAHAQHSRISIPYFLNPAYAYDYAPLSGTPRYRSINWGEFRAGRTAGDYADRGAEIQISDYAIAAEAADARRTSIDPVSR